MLAPRLEYYKDYILKQLDYRSMCIRNSNTWLSNSYKSVSGSTLEWFEFYKKFQTQEECLVDIFDLNLDDLTFKMPIIEGISLDSWKEIKKLSIDQRRNIGSKIIELYGRMQKFSVKINSTQKTHLFFHRDFCLTNLIYNIKKEKLFLIDPDSFDVIDPSLINPTYHGSFIDTLFNIRHWEILSQNKEQRES